MNRFETPSTVQCGIAAPGLNIEPRDKSAPTDSQLKPPSRHRTATRGRRTSLNSRDLEMHRQLMNDGRLKSGRAGAFVYYVVKGKQRWRLFVLPRDPRTPAQQRARAKFGAASRTWSANGPLTDLQRDAWRAEGAKTRSRPRLGCSGKLTGQQAFVGRNCARGQRELSTLLQPHKLGEASDTSPCRSLLIGLKLGTRRVPPSERSTRATHPVGEKPNEASRAHKLARVVEVNQCQWVAESTWDRHRTYASALPGQHRSKSPHPIDTNTLGSLN